MKSCIKNYIPLERCKDGYLYIIDARNARIGIFTEKEKAFTIGRHKFNDYFLFDEYHYDTGAPFGTVFPLEEIGLAPQFKNDREKLMWLNDKVKELHAKTLDVLWESNEDIRRIYKNKDAYFKQYK